MTWTPRATGAAVRGRRGGGSLRRKRVLAGRGPQVGDPRLEVYQAFGEASGVTGAGDRREVTVGGAPSVLWHAPEWAELVLVWYLGEDGMAFVANVREFSENELIELAASAVPGSG